MTRLGSEFLIVNTVGASIVVRGNDEIALDRVFHRLGFIESEAG